jgi:hypothetical protein
MKRIAIKYAFIVFVITIVWTLIEHTLGYNTTNHAAGQDTRLMTAFIYYAFVVLAIWRVRRQRGNTLSFGEGLKTGTIICLVYSVLATCWFALYAEVINPQYQPTLLAYERSKLEAAHATAEEIAKKLKEVEMSSGGSFVSYLLLFVYVSVWIYCGCYSIFNIQKEKDNGIMVVYVLLFECLNNST